MDSGSLGGGVVLVTGTVSVSPAQTTLYVNAECGFDCFDGLSPVGNCDACPFPAPPDRGPFRTLSRAANEVTLLGPGAGPFTIRIAGRADNAGNPFIHNTALGEQFPITIPHNTLVQYDPTHSDSVGGIKVRAIIDGESSASSAVRFTAATGQVFTSSMGLDGTGGVPYGLEIRGATNGSLFLESRDTATRLDIKIEAVLLSGGTLGNSLAAYAFNDGAASFQVRNCRIEADVTNGSSTSGNGVVVLRAGYDPQSGPTGAGPGIMTPEFRDTVITVDLDPATGLVASKYYGVYCDGYHAGSSISPSFLTVSLDGRSNPSLPEGIDQGVYVQAASATDSAFSLASSTVTGCGIYGIHVAAGLGMGPGTADITVADNRISNNGLRPDQLLFLPGSGFLLKIDSGGVVKADVSSNLFSENLIGMSVFAEATTPPKISIYNNHFALQVATPPSLDCLCTNGPCPVGVGIALFTEGQGVLDPQVVIDSNLIERNQGAGVLISHGYFFGSAGITSPVLRNNRIWNNAPLVSPPPCPLLVGHGVRIQTLGTPFGVIQPVLVNETIVQHPSFGVINASAAAVPEVWNSIVYDNNPGVTSPGAAKDLSGFAFGPPAGLASVNYSDFCGAPWTATPPVPCGSVSDPAFPHMCISSDPQFESAPPPPLAPNLQLICAGGGTVPPSPCSTPCYAAGLPGGGSRCIDRATSSAPAYSTVDATGAPRIGLVSGTAVPDMGALEKRTCTP